MLLDREEEFVTCDVYSCVKVERNGEFNGSVVTLADIETRRGA